MDCVETLELKELCEDWLNVEPPKTEADVKREMQLAAYKHDLSKAMKVEDLAKFYLEAGADPKYIAYRFGLALERCRRYVEALTKQREKQRERTNAMRGNRPSSEIGASNHGPGGTEEVRLPSSVGPDL